MASGTLPPVEKSEYSLPQVMGVLNVTPDSFSDGGQFNTTDAAVKRALEMVEAGASIIDIGGESTRPKGQHYGDGAADVASAQEKDRVLPVIRSLVAHGVPCISIDTWKAEVAEAALEAGAHMVNDVSGFRLDPNMAEVVARADCPVVLMHMRGNPSTTMQFAETFRDVVDDVCNELMNSVQIALNAGVRRERIILDPGLGFGKKGEQNYRLLSGMSRLQSLGFPVLLGASRKSFLGDTTGRKDPRERDYATAATVAHGFYVGADILRVHNVEAMMDVLRVLGAIEEGKSSASGLHHGDRGC